MMQADRLTASHRQSVPHVLFHRPTPWSSAIQCSTKVLARLTAARGLRTTYLQAPLDPAHLLRGRHGYLATWREGRRREVDVEIVTPVTPIPVRDVWPLDTLAAADWRYRLCWPTLRGAVDSPDLVWTTVPGSGAALKRSFPQATVVFHVIDYYPAFRGAAVQTLERSDYHAVDAVCTIGHTLRDYLERELEVPASKITVLGQGVEIESYRRDAPAPPGLAALPRPCAIWSGVLDKGDPMLFAALATTLRARGGSLVLIGPGATWATALAERWPDTVHLTGPLPAAALPGWLAHADLGIMLYDRARQGVYRGQNPLKLYEYAAAGLPILSTPHDEYRHIDPPVLEIRDENDIEPAITRALAESGDLRARSQQFAARHDWATILDRILATFLPGSANTFDRSL